MPFHRSRRATHGFTLIELMVVIAILGLLATLIVPSVIDSHAKAMVRKAEVDLRAIADATKGYYIAHQRLPTWTDLVTPDDKGHPCLEDVRDPWGNAYVLAPGVSASTLVIRCLGPDGVDGTDDDLVAHAR